MTIQDLKKLKKEVLTPCDVAPILGCDPNVIRFQARQDIKQLGFPAAKIGTRIKIPRRAFINWFEGKTEQNISEVKEVNGYEQAEKTGQRPGDGDPTG